MPLQDDARPELPLPQRSIDIPHQNLRVLPTACQQRLDITRPHGKLCVLPVPHKHRIRRRRLHPSPLPLLLARLSVRLRVEVPNVHLGRIRVRRHDVAEVWHRRHLVHLPRMHDRLQHPHVWILRLLQLRRPHHRQVNRPRRPLLRQIHTRQTQRVDRTPVRLLRQVQRPHIRRRHLVLRREGKRRPLGPRRVVHVPGLFAARLAARHPKLNLLRRRQHRTPLDRQRRPHQRVVLKPVVQVWNKTLP
mmetsp:Transcript_1633/g.5455  ORF Transcript_1633/g.5455 Transcript_1633/m.5455 type:complete len:247 (+) Transcript_1633:1550-2290(+)